MTTPTAPRNTLAFFAQAGIAFGLSLLGLIVGELYLPVTGWVRAFLALATVFLVSSTFTLASACATPRRAAAS
jgi:hypothetical protein